VHSPLLNFWTWTLHRFGLVPYGNGDLCQSADGCQATRGTNKLIRSPWQKRNPRANSYPPSHLSSNIYFLYQVLWKGISLVSYLTTQTCFCRDFVRNHSEDAC
jgi:hypothetical protein